ncbi:tetratricopeptide repeat protein [candidate division KSB1 bacterium]|nr:tetratricopeptide repeat protein [candidate division KSB1 bacterium]
MILKPTGEEFDRICGFDGQSAQFLQTLKDYLAHKNTLGTLQAQVELDPNNVESNFALATKYVARWEREKAVPFFQQILALDPQNKWQHHADCHFELAVNDARANDNILPLETFMRQNPDPKFLEPGYGSLIRYYQNKKNIPKLVETYEAAYQKLPPDAGHFNEYAWFIYEHKLKEKYVRGIEIAQQAVQLEPDKAHIWDTLAWLYYANGETANAIEALNKAVTLAPDVKGYQENLEKMKKGS